MYICENEEKSLNFGKAKLLRTVLEERNSSGSVGLKVWNLDGLGITWELIRNVEICPWGLPLRLILCGVGGGAGVCVLTGPSDAAQLQ